jgi:hypothetical protein
MGRSILNISLPEEVKKDIVRRAKKAKTTVSGYILRAVELEKSLISEEELLNKAKRARAEYRAGKTKILRSLEDLIK